MRSIRLALIATILATLLACLACGGSHSAGGGYTVIDDSPPPHAPAYGYRYRHPHDRVLLIYNPDLAVYRVSGYPNYYYSSGRYYRLRNGAWYYAPRIKGSWMATSYSAIPSGLHKKYKAPGHTKSSGYAKSSKHSKEKKSTKKYKRGHGKHGR